MSLQEPGIRGEVIASLAAETVNPWQGAFVQTTGAQGRELFYSCNLENTSHPIASLGHVRCDVWPCSGRLCGWEPGTAGCVFPGRFTPNRLPELVSPQSRLKSDSGRQLGDETVSAPSVWVFVGRERCPRRRQGL